MIKFAVNNIKNWIFVTGVIRSGTTFVGMVLSLPLEVDYIHEPFNPQCGLPGMNRWYPYIRPNLDSEEMERYHALTQKIFSYNFTLRNKIPENDPWLRKATKRIIGSRGPFYLRLAKPNVFHRAAVIKDPTANLLSEYLHLHFGVKPVILIKHPLSFIASLKRVNWWPHLYEINDQPHLIEDYFFNNSKLLNGDWPDPVLGAAAYWRAVHQVLLAQVSKYPSWQVVTHEEVSQNPVSVFKHLYEVLDLPWSERIKNKIIKQTQGNYSAQAKEGIVQDFKRNSAEIFKIRRDSLSLRERKAIFEIVEDIALQIYPRKSFAID